MTSPYSVTHLIVGVAPFFLSLHVLLFTDDCFGSAITIFLFLVSAFPILLRLRDGPPDGIQEGLIIDRFSEEGHSSQLPSVFADLCAVTGGDHDDRQLHSARRQFMPKIEAG